MPELPEPALWIDYLAPAISEKWYSNFGPVNKNFEYVWQSFMVAQMKAL